jgi:release factor glutamine methyltransferase
LGLIVKTETLGQTLRAATLSLAETSETARLDAEILLALTLRKERSYLRAWPEHPLTHEESLHFWERIEQRAQGTPIAYLVGEKEFWSRTFKVNPHVLIPRPETELLVELALDFLPPSRTVEILDLGTGSGIIAITLALERPLACVTALDISMEALIIAQENAQRLGADSIRFLQSHWLDRCPDELTFDLIVSNPPYVADEDPHLHRGDLRFEPKLALKSGKQGLDALTLIARESFSRLKPAGQLLLEHGYDQAQALESILLNLGYHQIHHHLDLQGHQRATSAYIP